MNDLYDCDEYTLPENKKLIYDVEDLYDCDEYTLPENKKLIYDVEY